MTRLQEILQRFEITKNQMVDLQKEYQDKPRGTNYTTRYLQLVAKLDFFKKAFREYGSVYTIAKVKGTRTRIGKKVKNIMVTEKFELYFSNVLEEEVHTLIKLRYPNVISYSVEIIKTGIILTK